jgi:hypothetical protein
LSSRASLRLCIEKIGVTGDALGFGTESGRGEPGHHGPEPIVVGGHAALQLAGHLADRDAEVQRDTR